MLLVAVLSANLCFAADPAAEPSGNAVAAATHDTGIHLAPGDLNKVPLEISLPKIAQPGRHLEAKYDVTKIGNRGVGNGVDFYSLEKERVLGKQLSTEVEHQVKLVTDPVVVEYINRLGQNLVRNSDAKVPFTIKVIDSDEVNAFALPGGYFYVNSGLIMASDNEAQLAGVMAHEIAHVAARHATKNETRADILQIATIPLIFFGGPAGYAVRQVMGLAVPVSFLKFSRDAEREADMLGMQYDYASGYDPQEFVKLFEKLKAGDKQNKHWIAKAFATHPMTEDRIKRAQKEIAEYLPARDNYIVDTSEFQTVRARVAQSNDHRQVDLGKVTPTLRKRGPESMDKKSDTKLPSTRPTLGPPHD